MLAAPDVLATNPADSKHVANGKRQSGSGLTALSRAGASSPYVQVVCEHAVFTGD